MSISIELARRPNRVVAKVEKLRFKPVLVNEEPFCVTIDGHTVEGLDPPPRVSKSSVEKHRDCYKVTDNLGSLHYMIEIREGRAQYFSKRAIGAAIVHNDVWIPFGSKLPSGHEEVFRLSRLNLPELKPGQVLTWSYAFARSARDHRGRRWGVLSADGYVFPLDCPPRGTADLWPPYVQSLRKVYRTDADWNRLIGGLEGKFPEDLFPKGAPITAVVRDCVEGRTRTEASSDGHVPRAFCFDGSLSGFDLRNCGGTVETGVNWGDTGHLAWIYRVRGRLAAVVVDKPIANSAAWVFVEPEGAAQLINPPAVGSDWRARHNGLRERAVYYCPHYDGWERRLTLMVLKLLANAGCSEAQAKYDELAVRDGDYRRAAKLVCQYLADAQKDDPK